MTTNRRRQLPIPAGMVGPFSAAEQVRMVEQMSGLSAALNRATRLLNAQQLQIGALLALLATHHALEARGAAEDGEGGEAVERDHLRPACRRTTSAGTLPLSSGHEPVSPMPNQMYRDVEIVDNWDVGRRYTASQRANRYTATIHLTHSYRWNNSGSWITKPCQVVAVAPTINSMKCVIKKWKTKHITYALYKVLNAKHICDLSRKYMKGQDLTEKEYKTLFGSRTAVSAEDEMNWAKHSLALYERLAVVHELEAAML